jgi:hypothetical protein
MTTVIYTAIFGGKDRLWQPRVISDDARYICFTDSVDLTSDVWEIMCSRSTGEDPCRTAKRLKILAHEHLDCQRSVWIDANLEIIDDITKLFARFDEPLAFFCHDKRGCVYDEALECIRRGLDHPALIDATVDMLRLKGYPARAGLLKGGVIFRRHTPDVDRFNHQWWQLVSRGSRRDQLTLPFALQSLRIPRAIFRERELHQLFHYHRHANGEVDQ